MKIVGFLASVIACLIAFAALVTQTSHTKAVENAHTWFSAVEWLPTWVLGLLSSPWFLSAASLIAGLRLGLAVANWMAAKKRARNSPLIELGHRASEMAYRIDMGRSDDPTQAAYNILTRDLAKHGIASPEAVNGMLDGAKVSKYLHYIAAELKRDDLYMARAMAEQMRG